MEKFRVIKERKCDKMSEIHRKIASLTLILKHELEYRKLTDPYVMKIEHMSLLAQFFQSKLITQKEAAIVIRKILDGELTDKGIWYLCLKAKEGK